jgi:lysophospholipase L1-like esterase
VNNTRTSAPLVSTHPGIGRLFTQRRFMLKSTAALLAAAALSMPSVAPARDREPDRWIGTWTTSPQAPEPRLETVASFDNQTIRQVVHTSIAGRKARVRLSNEYGDTPLVIGAVNLALHGGGAAIVSGSGRPLTFSGRTSFTIAPGAPALSDPIDFDVPATGNVVVSIYLPKPTAVTSLHRRAQATSYVSTPGDYSGAADMPTAFTRPSWFFLSGVSVEAASRRSAAFVALGDSITEGFASTPDTNRRYPNLLAERLQAHPRTSHVAVLNHGISGNRTLFDFIGPNIQARLDRDVLNAPGAKWVILLAGINNIGLPGSFGLSDQVVTADDIIAGHRQVIERARERGLKIYGGTLLPFEGAAQSGYFTPEGEAKRQAVNHWIRTSSAFDGVIDFDRVMRDPASPSRLLPAYDSGDHLHPNDAGYRAMAEAIDLRLFLQGNDD